MTVIRPNSISGVTSITALANEINVFRHNGVLAGLQLNGVNHHTSAGVSTFHTVNVLGNLDVAGVLTYQDVTNVDSLGIGTFRTGINVSGGQLDVGSNIKLGNAGVVTATSFVGDGSNLTGISAGTSLSGSTNNTVCTVTGANAIQGEANFTYDGNIITLNNDADQEGILMTGGDVYHTLTFNANRNIQNYSLGDVRGKWNGAEVNRIRFNTGADTTNKDEGWMTFWTKPSGGGIAERLRIGSDGQLLVGTTTAPSNSNTKLRLHLPINTSSANAFEISHNTNGANKAGAALGLAIANGGASTNAADLYFSTATGGSLVERLRIKSDGRIGINAYPSVNHEYLHIKPVGNNVLDLRYELNSDTDIRHKFYDNAGVWRGGFNYTTYANSSAYPNFHDSFYFLTDPGSNGTLATALRITNTGQFIKPLTYQFFVETSGTSVSGGWNKLTGLAPDSTHCTGVSNGTYWSNSNSRFTAPVTGTYQFFIGGFSPTAEGGGTNHRYMYLFRINGGNYSYGFGGNYSDNNTPMEGGTLNYKLTVNDYVEVWYYTAISATWGNSSHRFFWGGILLG